MNIYVDNAVCEWHVHQLQLPGTNLHKNLDSYLEQEQGYACYHVAFPVEQGWVERFHKAYNHSKHNFIFCSELHERTVRQLIALDLPNTTIFICGHIEYFWQHANVYHWMDWFITTIHMYKHQLPNLLSERLIPQANKHKRFDVLLGAKREHRDFVYNYINSHTIKEQVVMTYFNRIDQALNNNHQFILEQDGLELIPMRKLTHTIDQVKYYGIEKSLSQIVPITIYNQTYYSIVAETNFANHYNFYTEKIVKPIMAGRMFIVIAGHHYLKNLRALGFKTFGNIIDERYDEEIDQTTRWVLALEQAELLANKNPVEVYKLIQPIVDYNRELMMQHDWYHDVSDNFKNIITR